MAISDTITSMYENVGNVYDVLELAGADLTNVDKNIQNLKQSWEERLLYFLANGTDTLWNNWLPKVTGTGETITLNNTIEAKMDFVYKGNTSQYSTTGKNLCYFSNYTEYGATFNGSEIKVVNPNGTAYAGNNFNLQYDTSKSGKTYTIYICVNGTKETGAIGKAISINVAKTNNTTAARVLLPSDTGTFNNFVSVDTITLAQDEVFRNVYVVVNNSITANLNVKLMIVEGSYTAQTIGDYEPYTNGASPNPDYPQNIQVVSGDNTIKVEGKNLFDGVFRQGNRFTDGLSDTKRLFTTQNYPVKSGVSYTLSTTINPSAYKWAVNLSTSEYPILNITPSSQYYDSGWKTSSSFTFTPSQDGYLGIVVAKSNGSDNLTPSDIANVNWQLEYGSSPSAYIPYQVSQTYPISLGNIELCKIGDYQDKIYKDNGKWYLNKQIGKVVLDGSENWQSASSVVSGTSRFYYDDNKYMNNNVGSAVNAISDKFKAISWQQIFADDTTTKNAISTWASDTYEGRLVIRIDSSLASSVETFKTWLSTHNTTVYYVLATPTYEKITDTTLISQLEAIKKSYNTQTSISQVNNDLPFELDVVVLGE